MSESLSDFDKNDELDRLIESLIEHCTKEKVCISMVLVKDNGKKVRPAAFRGNIEPAAAFTVFREVARCASTGAWAQEREFKPRRVIFPPKSGRQE